MKTLYLDCGMGAAGDMLTAALLELHPDPAGFVNRLNALGLPGVRFQAEPAVKCGITGTHMQVWVCGEKEEPDAHHGHPHSGGPQQEPHEHEHHHGHGLKEIRELVGQLSLPQPVREDILAVYQLIAEAESRAHGKPVEQIHFHEVGALDAVADVTAACLLIWELAPGRILASPIHVGCGQVRCAHGILPVPAPATAWILLGVPTYGGHVVGELCTPTGAALLKHFVQEYGPQPPMRVERIGYGCGTKDFEQANCLRALWGETSGGLDAVVELRCNLDDMTPEAIGFTMDALFAAGALEVYTIPLGMKKNRPGVLLTCMGRVAQREELLRLLFLHTTTLGVRETVCNRYTLERSAETLSTAYGPVRLKRSAGWGVEREKLEYEDLARIARAEGISLAQAADRVRQERN